MLQVREKNKCPVYVLFFNKLHVQMLDGSALMESVIFLMGTDVLQILNDFTTLTDFVIKS